MITKYKSKSFSSNIGARKRNTRIPHRTTKEQSAPIFNQAGLRVMVLGGLEEVGRNMALIEYNKEIIIIDMGLMFPEEDMPGIDYIIPNTKYLEDKSDWIKGVIITHGHMDHIGGIPHIAGPIGNPPMFMGKLTAGLVQKRCEEFNRCPKLNISEINENSKIQLGKSFRVEFLRVNHSIPDSFGVIIHTPIGTIIHTGDFKIDYSPVNDKPADLNRIAQIGGSGILLLMSDSTDSTHPGYQVSESYIGDDMNNNVDIAHKIGYLNFHPSILMGDSDIKRLPDKKILVLGTGAQAESNAFLVRVVNGDHKKINLKQGDTVIFSSSVIPGNERSIQNLKDMIVRQGAKIIHYEMMDVHAGGHAKQEDLKLMMRLLKPQNVMPTEGNHYMLRAHAELAEQVGIPKENIFVADNGQVVNFIKRGNQVIGSLTKEKIETNYVMVDGLGVGDISNIVLRDRRVMSEDGMIVIIATVDSKTGDSIGNPDIISRGFVYMKENRELIEKTRMKVKKLVKDHDPRTPADTDNIKNKIRNEIGQFLFSQTKRRPMVLPVVIKV